MRRKRPAASLLVVTLAGGLAACGGSAGPAPVFTPGGGSGSTGPATSAPATSSSAAPVTSAGPLAMPPFGSNVTIGYSHRERRGGPRAAALTADGDFELAYLYAQYTGGRDTRWTAYASRQAAAQFRSALNKPSVTQQSFRGAVRYFAIRAFPDSDTRGAFDVTGCFDDAGATSTDLQTGQALPDTAPPNSHYFRYTDIVARRGGRWVVVGNGTALYYPQAKECKP
jgi:hypothetical protein